MCQQFVLTEFCFQAVEPAGFQVIKSAGINEHLFAALGLFLGLIAFKLEFLGLRQLGSLDFLELRLQVVIICELFFDPRPFG